MDILSVSERSQRMRQVRSKDTGPELLVRKLLFHKGYRYRLHVKNLAGKPDIVFVGRRKAIFVHGCFWHRHRGCPRATFPASHQEYWQEKFARNVERDQEAQARLKELGWDILVVWECETKDRAALETKLDDFLSLPIETPK